MNEQALNQLLEDLKKPTDIKHITPPAAVVDVLKREAMALDLPGFVDTCQASYQLLPKKQAFIQHKIPGLLTAYYFIMRDDLDQVKLGSWLEAEQGWAERLLSASADANTLQQCVDAIVAEVNAS